MLSVLTVTKDTSLCPLQPKSHCCDPTAATHIPLRKSTGSARDGGAHL
jgi:hypothetical protein